MMFSLIDCNNFYASCERAFNPKFIGKPVVVLSNNDGCVIARSNEAKQFVPMGAPAFKYKELFKKHQIQVFSSNFALYGDMSNRVMSILSTFSPDMEIYSIDEAFLQFKGFERFNLVEHCLQIKDKVKQCTQIPISIGIAPTKALAKVANKIAKKYPERTKGVYSIDTEEKRLKALKWTKIEDVWGIGARISKRLQAIGVLNAYQFTQLTDSYVQKEFSVVGLRLKKELLGESVLELEEVKDKKSISTTRSFAKNITDFNDLKERISTFSSSCAEKLRNQQSCCGALMVFIRTNRHKKELTQYNNSKLIELPYESNSDITLSKYAIKALESIYREGYEYKKAGVIVTGIIPDNQVQQRIFNNENPNHKKVMKTIDRLNHRFGNKKLKLATQNIGKTWIMKQENLSKRYTTRWDELLEVG